MAPRRAPPGHPPRPLALALAALLLAACQSGPAPRPRVLEATVLGLELQPGAGRLSLSLPLAPEGVQQVTWELALDGRAFATGLETVPRAVPGGLALDAPLAWRHFGWKDGGRWVKVLVRGEVTFTGQPVGVAYRGERELLVPGVPVLDSPVE
jgi:hypothetical protein